jgi:UDP-N-acetylmuramoyl-L-alanyl-D-glutamate--2,6-diaminopimelate ligase
MMVPSMIESTGKTLADIAHGVGAIKIVGNSNVVVTGVRQDSRQVLPGELFAVRGGARTTGWNFVADALARGAVAVMAEADLSPVPLAVPMVVVRDVRSAIARAAAIVYDDPTRALDVVGITGTNGKTTTSYLVSRALESSGQRPGIIGTVGYRFEDLVLDAPHTTPESDEIARIARTMRDRGASHLVMEVSSHALVQGRVEAVHFRAAAFTNLTQDHLDFHGDMAAYGAAKARLFLDLTPGASIVNVDDNFGRDLANRIKGPLLRVSSAVGSSADVAPTSVSLEPNRTRAALRTPKGNVEIDSALIGAHNLSNMVVCVGIAAALGLNLDATASALAEASVPGRLERCDGAGDDLVVVVDYAHTPDALERALSALTVLREGTRSAGRLICVFGCGGDRDPNKRAPMGRAVAQWADIAVVTNDNPRTEDPEAIAKAILPGLEHARAVVVELDRERAIASAIAGAKPGDVVLIAGKGHETYQIVGNVARHFDDREQARAALARRRAQKGNA